MHDTRPDDSERTSLPAVVHRQISHGVAPAPCVEIVVPVFNEAAVVDSSIATLHAFLTEAFPFSWRITIVDNASTDGTWFHAARLARDIPEVRAWHLDRKGRGLALRSAWAASDAAIFAYMDVDLSTDLDALLPLVAPLISGHSDVAIGSRLSAGSVVARGPKRELISRSYNAILRTAFATRVHDAQCGFKALRADVARRLLPCIEDDGWFFDTELLLLAEHNGLRIHELAVAWTDDADSRVHLTATAIDDLRGTIRMLGRFACGRGDVDLSASARPVLRDDLGRRFVTFAAIGTASTTITLALFLLLRASIGAVNASVVAISATFVANTWAHTRYTARRARPRWLRAFAVYAGSLAVTSGALALTDAAGGGLLAELAILLVTGSAATAVRFVVVGSAR